LGQAGSLPLLQVGADQPYGASGGGVGLTDYLYNAVTGTLDSTQIAAIQQANYAANLQAATDPTTGVVNQALLTQANANSDAALAQVVAQTPTQSTGSTIADLWDSAIGTGPGIGTTLSNWFSGLTSSGTSLATWALIIGGAGLGVYLIAKSL
jgi:hypothetical protein